MSAVGSGLLLATTNAITQWSAVVPFLWVVPLSLYLLTFVVAFGIRASIAGLPFVVGVPAAGGHDIPPRAARATAEFLSPAAAPGGDAVRGLHDLPWES